MSSPIDARLYEITEAICERLRKKDFPSKKYWTSFDCRNVFLALKKLYRCFEYTGSPDPLVDVYNVYNEIAFEDFENIDDLIDYYSKVFHYRIPPEEKVLEKVYLSEEARELIEEIKSTYDYLYDRLKELERLGLKPEEIPSDIARIESEIRKVEEAGKKLKTSEYLRLLRELNKIKKALNRYKKLAEKYRKGYEELKKKFEERKAIPLVSAIKRMKNELFGYFYYVLYKHGEKSRSRAKALFEGVFNDVIEMAKKGGFKDIEEVKKFIEEEAYNLIKTLKPPAKAKVKVRRPPPPTPVEVEYKPATWEEVVAVYGEPEGRNPKTGRVMEKVTWFYYPEYGDRYEFIENRYSLWYDEYEKRYYLYDRIARTNIPVTLKKVIEMGLARLVERMTFTEHLRDAVLRTYRAFKDIEYTAETLSLPVDKVKSIVEECLSNPECREKYKI